MSAANNFVSELFHLAVAQGLDADNLLDRAGLPASVIDQPEQRVPTEKLAVIVESIWDHLQDEAMGLSPYPIPRGSFFMMAKAAIHENNLGKALELGARFYGLVTKAFQMEVVRERHTASLVFRMASTEMDRHHLFAEINLMAWHRFASWLIAESVTLNDVYFDYATPAHVSEYAYLFPGRHHFNAEWQALSFKRSFLDREITQKASSLKAFIKRCPVEFFVQPKTDFSVSHELQRLLRRNFQDGFPLIEDAADALHVSRRTLIRKLEEEGTSYQQLKNLVRRDRAIDLLTNHQIPLGEIAEAVGFSDAAVFARAFKSWTGVSPRSYRGSASGSKT